MPPETKKENKYKKIAKTYIDTGFNKTETARKIKPHLKNSTPKYQHQAGKRMVENERTQKALKEVLEDRGLDNVEISRLLKRNALQKRSISGSNKALELAIEVKGAKAPQENRNININLTGEDAEERINERISQLQEELKKLNSE